MIWAVVGLRRGESSRLSQSPGWVDDVGYDVFGQVWRENISHHMAGGCGAGIEEAQVPWRRRILPDTD